MMRVIFVLLSLTTILWAAPPPLTYYTEDYPPANFSESGVLKGASVEILQALWKQMGEPAQPILLVPWARGYHEAQVTPGTVLFSMSRHKQREQLFQWVGPIFVARHVLISRKDRKLKLDSLPQAKQFRTAVIREDISELSLHNAGFEDKHLVVTTQQGQLMDLVLTGRVDFANVSVDALEEYCYRNQIDRDQFAFSLIVEENPNYFAFHRGTDPALIAKFQKALDAIRPAHMKILQKYRLRL